MPNSVDYSEILSSILNVFSLVVGMTSLVIAFFSIWLSWQFYKQSQTQSDKVQDSVGRIDQVVTEMHGNVRNIVQQAVTAWTKSSQPDQQEETALKLVGSFDELRGKVEDLEKGGAPGLRDEVLALVEDNQRKTEDLLASLRESRLRSAFPAEPNEPNAGQFAAVRVIHKPMPPGADSEEGEIVLEVQRPAQIITGAIYLMRPDQVTVAEVDLLSAPAGSTDLRIGCGLGAGGLLNVHLNAAKGERISVGRYAVRYKASTK